MDKRTFNRGDGASSLVLGQKMENMCKEKFSVPLSGEKMQEFLCGCFYSADIKNKLNIMNNQKP